MTSGAIPALLTAAAAWLATEGRTYVFVGLMSIFVAAFLVAVTRRSRPEEGVKPVFQGPRRPPAPGQPGWRSEAELAAMLLEAGRTLEAVQAYRRLLALDPADPDALYNLGHAYFRLRLYEQARACWRAVRRIEPDAEDVLANLRLIVRLLKADEAVRLPSRASERLRALAGREGAREPR